MKKLYQRYEKANNKAQEMLTLRDKVLRILDVVKSKSECSDLNINKIKNRTMEFIKLITNI